MMKFLFRLTYFGSPLALITLLLITNTAKYSSLNYLLPMILGVFSYTWLLWQFVLSARPKFIEKHFGLDKLYRFHGIMAIVAISTVILHKTLFERFFPENVQTTLGSIALFLFASITLLSLIFMSSSVLRKLPVFSDIVKILNSIKVITYERIKLIHNLTFIALMFMQVHVLFTSSARNNPIIFQAYMGYFFLAVSFYLYHKFLKPWFLDGKRYYVSQLINESNDTLTIELSPKSGRVLKYHAGQFGFFKVLKEGMSSEEHPFSISSSPVNHSHITITVKSLGDYTQSLKQLTIGDEVTVDAPYGRFSYTAFNKENATVFVAGGVGITPVLSMMQYMNKMDEHRKVLLIWSVKKQTDLIRMAELKSYETQMPNFKCVPIVSSDASWQGESGRLDAIKLKSLLEANGFTTEKTGYFVCGPQNLMYMTLLSLKQMGIAKKQIHFEQFTV